MRDYIAELRAQTRQNATDKTDKTTFVGFVSPLLGGKNTFVGFVSSPLGQNAPASQQAESGEKEGATGASESLPFMPMTTEEETVIRAWLARIEESDPAIIAEVLPRCREDSDARAYFVGRATKVREKVRGETIEERAAIMEFDGGLSCLEAERAAVLDAGEKPCKVCAHFRRPGLSDGYCHWGARPDLPPAYGANHPLRQLPDDMGKSCHAFRLS